MNSLPAWVWACLLTALALGGLWLSLPWVIGPLLRLLLLPRYGLIRVGIQHIPKNGPGVLAANHVSWIDGFLMAAASPRPGKALTNASFINLPVFRAIALRAGIIPIPFQGPKAQRAAIDAVRSALDRGQLVLLFPEAQITRNGLLGPFYRGLELMLKNRDGIPVIPVYQHNLWGSVFSFSGGRFFTKRPRGLRRGVIVAFGPPLTSPITAFKVRQAVQLASVHAIEQLAKPPGLPDSVDLGLPHWRHPTLGLLAVSTVNYQEKGITQIGLKPGTLGQPPPGVALQVLDDYQQPAPPDSPGNIYARVAGRPLWIDTGATGSIDRDGFVSLDQGSTPGQEPEPLPPPLLSL